MGGGGGGVEKWRLKLTSAKVEVEVEAELGNYTLFWGLSVPGEVPQCSASTLALLAGFLNSAKNAPPLIDKIKGFFIG